MSMTAGELRAALKGVDDDVLVVMSSDAEGNSFSPLSDTDVGQYHWQGETTWSGEILNPNEQDEDRAWALGLPPCVVLWPVN
jgi:hypothetical protein